MKDRNTKALVRRPLVDTREAHQRNAPIMRPLVEWRGTAEPGRLSAPPLSCVDTARPPTRPFPASWCKLGAMLADHQECDVVDTAVAPAGTAVHADGHDGFIDRTKHPSW